jgi:hypothetical protein
MDFSWQVWYHPVLSFYFVQIALPLYCFQIDKHESARHFFRQQMRDINMTTENICIWCKEAASYSECTPLNGYITKNNELENCGMRKFWNYVWYHKSLLTDTEVNYRHFRLICVLVGIWHITSTNRSQKLDVRKPFYLVIMKRSCVIFRS